jgi:hypothetical protein
MYGDTLRIRSLDHLRQYVHETLCHQNELELNYFRITERLLLRHGKPCGVFFCLHGPRSTKFTAIWETDGNTVLFYGSAGQRLHKAQLPPTVSLAAEPVGDCV